jgi:hypothetical protein
MEKQNFNTEKIQTSLEQNAHKLNETMGKWSELRAEGRFVEEVEPANYEEEVDITYKRTPKSRNKSQGGTRR